MKYSYCGDRFPNTVITQENQFGLPIETNLHNSAKGFSAQVTLLDDAFSYILNKTIFETKIQV